MTHNLFYRCNCCTQLFDLRIQVDKFIVNLNIRCSRCGVSHSGVIDLRNIETAFDFVDFNPEITNATFVLDDEYFIKQGNISLMNRECDIFEISYPYPMLLGHKGKPQKQMFENASPFLMISKSMSYSDYGRFLENLDLISNYKYNIWPKVKTVVDIMHYAESLSTSIINSLYFSSETDFDHNYADCCQDLICYILLLRYYWSELTGSTEENGGLMTEFTLMDKDSLSIDESLEFRSELKPLIDRYIKSGMIYNGFNLLDRWLSIIQDLAPTLMSRTFESRDNYTNQYINVYDLMRLYVDTYEFCGSMIRPIRIENAFALNSYDSSIYDPIVFASSKRNKEPTLGQQFAINDTDLGLVEAFKLNFNPHIRNSIGHYDFDVDEVKSIIKFNTGNAESIDCTILEFSDYCCKAFDSFLYALFVLLEFEIMKHYIDGLSLSYNKENKVGRNELCPCHSLKKYKKCHGQNKNYKG